MEEDTDGIEIGEGARPKGEAWPAGTTAAWLELELGWQGRERAPCRLFHVGSLSSSRAQVRSAEPDPPSIAQAGPHLIVMCFPSILLTWGLMSSRVPYGNLQCDGGLIPNFHVKLPIQWQTSKNSINALLPNDAVLQAAACHPHYNDPPPPLRCTHMRRSPALLAH